MFHKIGKKYRETALIKLIIVGLILGIIIALAAPQAVPAVSGSRTASRIRKTSSFGRDQNSLRTN